MLYLIRATCIVIILLSIAACEVMTGMEGNENSSEELVEECQATVQDAATATARDFAKFKFPTTVSVIDFVNPSSATGEEVVGKVFLVGTAHFSLESQHDVRLVIQSLQPDVVMVELCQSRVAFLTLDEETVLNEAQKLTTERIMATIKQSGLFQGLLHVLLLSMSAHITRELGMAPGGEFRAAYQEAKKISDCRLHLGDRPIQITLQRALASLSAWQKVRLAWFILTCKNQKITKEDVERCKQTDLLEEMLREMAGEFPGLSRIFVQERDEYMAFGLKRLIECIVNQKNKNPQNGFATSHTDDPAVVVAVVGIGHVAGIVANWNMDRDDVFALLEVPEPSNARKYVGKFIKGALLSMGCYFIYKTTQKYIFR